MTNSYPSFPKVSLGAAAMRDFISAEGIATVGCRLIDKYAEFWTIDRSKWVQVFAVFDLDIGATFLKPDSGGAITLLQHTDLSILIARLPHERKMLRRLQSSNPAMDDDNPAPAEIGEVPVLISLPADIDRFIQQIVDCSGFINRVLPQVIAAASTVDRQPSIDSDETGGGSPICEIEYGHGYFVDGQFLFKRQRLECIRQTTTSLH